MQFKDWERASAPRANPHEAIKCKNCSCEWFEQVKATKVDLNIICALGQPAPEDNALAYSQILLRCLKCNDLQELPINFSSAPKQMQDSYVDLTKQLQEEKKE
jgi:Na+-transporting NADH:ubiquinone oxidoreductase subunit NqrF